MRSTFWGLLDLGITQKEHKKRRNSQNFNLKNEKSIKFERRNRLCGGIFALFGLCLNEAAP